MIKNKSRMEVVKFREIGSISFNKWLTGIGFGLFLIMLNVKAAPLLTFSNLNNGGFGELAMTPNDDGSSSQLNLPFNINFFGNTYSNFFINNNGNITFNGPTSIYTPDPFPASANPMIAPFWGDVDTSCATCGSSICRST